MKYLITLTILLILFSTSKAQITDTGATPVELNHRKTNPIIFSNINFGGGIGGLRGLSIGANLNIQVKNSLITARVNNISQSKAGVYAILLPIFKVTDANDEFALLYGYRKIYYNTSFSFSVGFSYNERRINRNTDYKSSQSVSRYAGAPFEINVLWFNGKKERYHIYGIIPVGRPTGLSRKLGFRLHGNFSKNSYAALGIVYGWGFHKHY